MLIHVYLHGNLQQTFSLSSHRITGFQLPAPVTSTGSIFSLRLTSDFAVSAHGFKIYYEGETHYSTFHFLCCLQRVLSLKVENHCTVAVNYIFIT